MTENTSLRPGKHAFVTAFLSGLVLIFAMKFVMQGLPFTGGLIAAALGIAIMRVYMVVEKRKRPANEYPYLGDEIYYLGLLYTLISLCAALVTLFFLEGWNFWVFAEQQLTLEQRTDEMVGSFGIALSTTIAGIVMRIVLQQWGTGDQMVTIGNPNFGEHDQGDNISSEGYGSRIAINLEQYTHELRRQLQDATNAFSTYTNQSILHAKTVHIHMDEMMRTFHEGLEEKAVAQLESVKRIHTDMANNVEMIAERTGTQQIIVQRILEKLEAQVGSMGDSIERVRIGSNETATNLGAIAVQSRASAQEFAKGGKALTGRLVKIAAASERQEEALNVSMTRIRALADITKEEVDTRRELGHSIAKVVSEAVKKIYDDMAHNSELIMERTEAQRITIQKVLEKLEAQVGTMGDSVERIRVGSNETAANLEAIVVQSRMSTQAFAEGGQAMADRFADVAAASKRQEEALDATVAKLKALADVTGEEVDLRKELGYSIAKIGEATNTVDGYGRSLKESEREIGRINVGLNDLQRTLMDESLRFSGILREAILVLGKVKRSNRSVLRRFFGRN